MRVGFRVNMMRTFFDRPAVMQMVHRWQRGLLSAVGSFVRQKARVPIRSARRPGQYARPGRPPLSHTGLLRDRIFFAFDKGKRSVVIGPELVRAGSRIPHALEYGGMSIGLRNKPIRVHEHPFMRPAFHHVLTHDMAKARIRAGKRMNIRS